jgi:hypothetical protein
LRGYQKSGIAAAIREAGGAIYAVTSEPQTLASEAQRAWELEFAVVGDPHHEIADACRERGWLSLFINRHLELLRGHHGFASHPRGYFQPGVLVLSSTGRVLYRWRSRPTHSNTGGATRRPLAEDVWAKVQTALAEPPDAPDAEMDAPDRYDMSTPPWPLFVLLLLANGNFLRPTPFPLERAGPDDIGSRAKRAMAKIPLFVGAWALAFWWLPTWLPAVALACWLVLLGPSIRALNREFQHIPSGEPD